MRFKRGRKGLAAAAAAGAGAGAGGGAVAVRQKGPRLRTLIDVRAAEGLRRLGQSAGASSQSRLGARVERHALR